MSIKITIPTKELEELSSRIRNLPGAVTQSTAHEIGRSIVTKMQSLIPRGLRPVEGGPGTGREFGPYRGSYIRIKGRSTSVDLTRSGRFLEALTWRVEKVGKGYMATVGYFSKYASQIESYLRDGRHNRNDRRPRPTIPSPQAGEKFVKVIRDQYIAIIRVAVRTALKK